MLNYMSIRSLTFNLNFLIISVYFVIEGVTMKRIKTADLVPGLVLAEDVYNFNGQMILPKGLVLTDKVITRLEFYSILSVRCEDTMSEDFENESAETVIPTETVSPSETVIPADPDEPSSLKRTKEYAEFKAEFEETLSGFKDSINNIVELNSPINTDELLDNTKDLIMQAKSTSFSTMDMLHNMRMYDDLTYAHCMNVALICNVFAGWLKMSEEDTDLLTLCGLLHDIGKLKIPDTIIKKPSKLTNDEYSLVKTHTVEGYKILKAKNVNPRIFNSALMHHEKCDGSGYPLSLTAEKIDKFAKIVAIVDVYDAMTSARVYRGPLCPFKVIELYENEGLQKYDTFFIMTFLENVGLTYLHYKVRLSDGREGKIVFINKNNPSKPIVQCGDTMVDLSSEKDLHIEEIL